MTSRSIACASLLEGAGYDVRGPRRIRLDGGRIGAIEEMGGETVEGDALFAYADGWSPVCGRAVIDCVRACHAAFTSMLAESTM